MFVFWDFNIYYKDRLIYFGATDWPGELCYNFSISNELTQIVNFPTRISDKDSHSPTLLILFLSSTLVFFLQLLSLHCKILVLLFVVSVSVDFPSNWKRDALFHRIAYDYSRADCDGLHDHFRDVFYDDIFKLCASAAASEFCEWVQVGIDVYIPLCMYKVKPHSSPWYLATCAAAIAHRNHFFVCTNRINLLNLK